ncbi:hypothetical protein PMZ80_008326 [Knufia obscura]|uniref:RING-type domain-containing protein n=1 Tax=Knufia obscura TaxID=1635080 RepID=A0ABR0RFM9_9EURO|nr:hypothetical protein PMZ80_008326 [Knufia obscura]
MGESGEAHARIHNTANIRKWQKSVRPKAAKHPVYPVSISEMQRRERATTDYQQPRRQTRIDTTPAPPPLPFPQQHHYPPQPNSHDDIRLEEEQLESRLQQIRLERLQRQQSFHSPRFETLDGSPYTSYRGMPRAVQRKPYSLSSSHHAGYTPHYSIQEPENSYASRASKRASDWFPAYFDSVPEMVHPTAHDHEHCVQSPILHVHPEVPPATESEHFAFSNYAPRSLYQIPEDSATNAKVHGSHHFLRATEANRDPGVDRDSAERRSAQPDWQSPRPIEPPQRAPTTTRALSRNSLPVAPSFEHLGLYAKEASSTASFNTKAVEIYRPEYINSFSSSESESPTNGSWAAVSDNETEDVTGLRASQPRNRTKPQATVSQPKFQALLPKISNIGLFSKAKSDQARVVVPPENWKERRFPRNKNLPIPQSTNNVANSKGGDLPPVTRTSVLHESEHVAPSQQHQRYRAHVEEPTQVEDHAEFEEVESRSHEDHLIVQQVVPDTASNKDHVSAQDLPVLGGLGDTWQVAEESVWRRNSSLKLCSKDRTRSSGIENLSQQASRRGHESSDTGLVVTPVTTSILPKVDVVREETSEEKQAEPLRKPVLVVATNVQTMASPGDIAETTRPCEVLLDEDQQATYEAPPATQDESCDCGKTQVSSGSCYFCWACNGIIYCDICWPMCAPHKRVSFSQLRNGGPAHDKGNPVTSRKIFDTLESHHDAQTQDFLHDKDTHSAWFGTGKDPSTGAIVFRDFGRYARLMQDVPGRSRRPRHPALASFVGETNAGKSSLVKLLIELCGSGSSDHMVPVVGTSSRSDLPTSGDVHLYSDPTTFPTSRPVLYADCEGLHGGERMPSGAHGKSKTIQLNMSPTSFIKAQHHASEREIMWAETAEKRSREYQVHKLYPRLLYSFSDVICFVTKNPRTIEKTVQQLLDWAAAALETSSNQPVMPHAIIILNACEDVPERFYDVDWASSELMKQVNDAVHDNHILKKFADFWRGRARTIDNVHTLIESYYSSIRVIRIPASGRPKVIERQVRRLYSEIQKACEKSHDFKHKSRMLLNSEELQPYLRRAFDHFSQDLNRPFDFVTASLVNNPIPSHFGGNVLKLAVEICKQGSNSVDGVSIFKELSFMVASCIMLDSVRNGVRGPADRILAVYLSSCRYALATFCDRHWPCEYIHSRMQGRCVNVRVGHQKGHQTKAGKLVGAGTYEASFTAESHWEFFQYCVYLNLRSLLERLYQATKNDHARDAEEAAILHQEFVLTTFFHHLGGAQNFVSFTACFCCLFNVPEHSLPCGHLLCTSCVHAYGVGRGQCFVDMNYCPLHDSGTTEGFSTPCSVFLKPRGAGIRILCLDSVGVGAIAQLVVLQHIEFLLGGLPLQAFFDLIVGTGLSAIPALGLGAEGWSVDQAITAFKRICSKALNKRKVIGMGLKDPLKYFSSQAREAQALEAELRSSFGEKTLFAGLSRQQDDPSSPERRTKVAVTTATASGTSVLLGNYNGLHRVENGAYSFHRAERPQDQMRIWHAARAASATPLSPFSYGTSGQMYQDDSFAHGCPIEPALKEADAIWPDRIDAGPDMVLSVNVGFKDGQNRPLPIRKTSRLAFLSKERQALHRASSGSSQPANDREHVWDSVVSQRATQDHHARKYNRLHLDLGDECRNFDESTEVDRLEQTARVYCTSIHANIRIIADQLLATSFYFLLDENNTRTAAADDSVRLEGAIHCRFPSRSERIQRLGLMLHQRMRHAYSRDRTIRHPYFAIREVGSPIKEQRIYLEHEVVDTMIRDGLFHPQEVSSALSNRMAVTEFLFNFGGICAEDELYYISGGTRCVVDEIIQGMQCDLSATPLSPTQVGAIDLTALIQKKATWGFEAADFLHTNDDPLHHFNDTTYCSTGNARSSLMSRYLGQFRPPDQSHVTKANTHRPRRSIPWSSRSPPSASIFTKMDSSRTEVQPTVGDVDQLSTHPNTYEAMSKEVQDTSRVGTSGVHLRMASMNQQRAPGDSLEPPGSPSDPADPPPHTALDVGQSKTHEIMGQQARESMNIENQPYYPSSALRDIQPVTAAPTNLDDLTPSTSSVYGGLYELPVSNVPPSKKIQDIPNLTTPGDTSQVCTNVKRRFPSLAPHSPIERPHVRKSTAERTLAVPETSV